MNLLVDTSVWSLALRRDAPSDAAEVARLLVALEEQEPVFTTGLILQEILQGYDGPRAREKILREFDALPMLVPDREDHVAAAGLRNLCRRRGVQTGTIDALLAAIAIRHDLHLITTDRDFFRMAEYCTLRLWKP
jgi:predicted nucleic acid-binding protein